MTSKPGSIAYSGMSLGVTRLLPRWCIGETLTGTRLFTLPATDTTALLTVLRDAQGPDQPHPDPHTAPPHPTLPSSNGQTPPPMAPQPRQAPNEKNLLDEPTQLESTHPTDAPGEPVATDSE